MHKALFWVAVAVLQLDEVNLYSAGTALLEQNLHTLDSMRVFNDKVQLELDFNQLLQPLYNEVTEGFVVVLVESRGGLHGDPTPARVAL